MKKTILAIVSSGIWIMASEFIRNEYLFRKLWVEHYQSLGLTFQTLPIHGVMWMIWSFLFSFLLYRLLRRFSFLETLVYGWLFAFVLMWFTIFNLQVLPLPLILGAIPLSLIEVMIAEWIIQRF